VAKRIVILGAGYGGIRCALTLEGESRQGEVEVVLVNKHNYHQFIAQLHESAVGLHSGNDIRIPLNEIFEGSQIRLIKDVVLRILPKENRVLLQRGVLEYDYLVVGLGSEPEYLNVPGLEQYSLTLRSLNSAKLIRTHIENSFARFKADPSKTELLVIVIGGAGFTGIELAGELADWMPSLAGEYDVPENLVSLICIEAASTVMAGYDRQLVQKALEVLREKKVRIITGAAIESVSENEVRLNNGEVIRTGTFIWTGGIRANRLVAQAGFATAVRGRARVNKYLQAIDYPNVYFVGDNAFITNPVSGKVMGPTAQVAIQSGHMAARNILADIRGQSLYIFYPREFGRVVSLGRRIAIGKIGRRYRTTGKVAGMLKEAVKWKYLFTIGGLRLVAKRMLNVK